MNAMLQQFYMMPRFRFGVMSVAVNKPEGVQQGTAWKGEITSALQVHTEVRGKGVEGGVLSSFRRSPSPLSSLLCVDTAIDDLFLLPHLPSYLDLPKVCLQRFFV